MKYNYLAYLALLTALSACTNTAVKTDADQHSNVAAAGESHLDRSEEDAEVISRPFPADTFEALLVAEFAVRRNRFDLALGNYMQQAHRTRDPGVTARATRLAQYLKADKAALDAALLWIELEPDNIEAQYTTANLLTKAKRPMEAMVPMSIVLANDGRTNFAAIAASAHDLPATERLVLEDRIDALLLDYPGHGQLLTAKSLLLQQRGESEAALVIIGQVRAADDDDLHAIIVETQLLVKLQRQDEAIALMSHAVEQHPNNRRLRLQYARLLMPEHIELAQQQFERLLQQSPHDADLLLSLGLISKETGQTQQASEYFQQLLSINKKTTEAHYYLGQMAEQRQHWPDAIAHYQQIPIGSNFLAASNRITAIYLQQGQLDEARLYLTTLRLENPEHSVRFYILEAELLLKVQRYSDGHQLLSEALAEHPQQPNLLYTRAMFSEKLDNIALMKQDLEDIIRKNPNHVTALNALGYMLANRAEELEQAYQYIRRALELKPGDPAILDSLGWVEYRRGNLDRAKQLLTEAYQAFPDHEVAAHLGEVLWTMQQPAAARLIWQQALEKRPDSPILEETIQRLELEGSDAPSINPEPPSIVSESTAGALSE